MNEKTVFIYSNNIGRIEFSYKSSFWIEEINSSSSVDIQQETSKSIGQVGTNLTGQSVQSKTFTIDGIIYEPLDYNRKKLIEVIAPQVKSKLTIIENGETWEIDVIPLKTPIIQSGNVLQNFQLELFAPYPYWKSKEVKNNLLTGLTKLFKFPFYTGGKWYISKYTDNYFSTVNNSGNVPIEFTAIFSARSEVVTPQLYQVDTGKSIVLNITLKAGEQIKVSTINGTRGVVFINSLGVETNGFKYLKLGSDLNMSLNVGDNLFKTDATVNRTGLDVRIIAPQGVLSGV